MLTTTGVPALSGPCGAVPSSTMDSLSSVAITILCESVLPARLVHHHLRNGHLPSQSVYSFLNAKV